MSDEDNEIPDNLPAIQRELENDTADMANTGGDSAYWKNPRRQERNLALHEARERLLGGEDAHEESPAVVVEDQDVGAALNNLTAMGTIGGQFAEEIQNTGAKAALTTIEETRLDILQGMGDTADEVVAAFDVLGGNVRGAVYAELARANTPRLPPADSADLEEFANTSAGDILVDEWGAEAAHKFSVILFRWERLTEPLSDAEFDQLDDFYRNRLRPHERAAVLRRLAL